MVLTSCDTITAQIKRSGSVKEMSEGNFTPQKMIQFRYETSEPEMPHWCVAFLPEDPTATVTYLQGKAAQNLTFKQAEEKAAELNERAGGDQSHTAAGGSW